MKQPANAGPAPLCVVLNACAGRGQAEETARAIEHGCAEAAREHHLFVAEQSGQLASAVAEAMRRAKAVGGVIVAAGGDGTINAVAQAALGSGCAFGVLPQGTFNYFSRTHGIPSDTSQALALLLRARPQAVQVGVVNQRVFLVNASLGLYVKLLEDREALKARFGRSRLVAFGAAFGTLLRGGARWDLRIASRGQERFVRTSTLFVGNNALQLEQVGLPHAQAVEQGELAAVALLPVGAWARMKLALRGALGRLGEADNIVSISFRSMSVEPARRWSRKRIKVATDGEVAWMQMPLHFSVAPEPLWLLKDEPAAGQDVQP